MRLGRNTAGRIFAILFAMARIKTDKEEICRDRVADGEWKAAIRPVPPRKTNGAWLLTLSRGTEQVEIPVSDFASVADADDADNLFSIWF